MVCLLCDYKILLTVFNQSYNCQTSHYLGRNRLLKPFLILPSLIHPNHCFSCNKQKNGPPYPFIRHLKVLYLYNSNVSFWFRGSVPSSQARGQWFKPRRQQYFKLLLDPGDFHSNPSRLLSFNKSETVLWTIAKL